MTTTRTQTEHIRKALAVFFTPGDVVELRAVGVSTPSFRLPLNKYAASIPTQRGSMVSSPSCTNGHHQTVDILGRVGANGKPRIAVSLGGV